MYNMKTNFYIIRKAVKKCLQSTILYDFYFL